MFGYKEFNPLKIVAILKFAVSVFLLALLLVTPASSHVAWIYAWIFIACVLLLLIDWFFHDFPYSELFNTVTVEEGNEFLLQSLGVSARTCLILSIVAGIIWGIYYASAILLTGKPFLFVPDMFQLMPITYTIDAKTYNAIQSSWAVADVEELLFCGILFPTLWSIIATLISKNKNPLALYSAMFIAMILTGYVASFVFHSFSGQYQANLYAFDSAFWHFTISSGFVGVTGNNFAGFIAHAIHNFAVKIGTVYGTYSAIPLQMYFPLDVNR